MLMFWLDTYLQNTIIYFVVITCLFVCSLVYLSVYLCRCMSVCVSVCLYVYSARPPAGQPASPPARQPASPPTRPSVVHEGRKHTHTLKTHNDSHTLTHTYFHACNPCEMAPAVRYERHCSGYTVCPFCLVLSPVML